MFIKAKLLMLNFDNYPLRAKKHGSRMARILTKNELKSSRNRLAFAFFVKFPFL